MAAGGKPPIYTKTGDDGTTGLLFGGRVSKADPVVEVCGAVDEAVATRSVWLAQAWRTKAFRRSCSTYSVACSSPRRRLPPIREHATGSFPVRRR